MSNNNQFTPAQPRSIIRKEYFEGTSIKGAKVGRTFKFKHILITNGQYIQPDYNCFGDKDIIDITHVTSYPEGYIALIDASEGLPEELYWYLDYRAQLLLRIVNEHRDRYKDIENCAAYRDLITVICFMNKYSKKFKDSKGFYRILIRTYANAYPDKFIITCVNYWDTNKHGPKPIPISENTRYKDYSGAFDVSKIFDNDNNIYEDINKAKEAYACNTVEDFDPATLYPTKFDPVPVNVDEMINNMLEQTCGVDKLLTNNCWKSALTFMICTFNAYIDAGKSLQEVWELPIGKYLSGLIDNLFENGTNTKANISFSIRVGDDCKLVLGEYEDVDPREDRGEVLTKTGDIIRITNCENQQSGKKQDVKTDKSQVDSITSELKTACDDVTAEIEAVRRYEHDINEECVQLTKDIELIDKIRSTILCNTAKFVNIHKFINGYNVDVYDVSVCLDLLVDFMNIYVEYGYSLEEAWKTDYGKLLVKYIDTILNPDNAKKLNGLCFSIYVDDDNRLIYAGYNDVSEKNEVFDRSLTKEGQYIRFKA